MAMDIQISAVKKQNQFGPGDYFILQEVEKDLTINLKDWFIQFLPPEKEDGENGRWVLLLQPRRKVDDSDEATDSNRETGSARVRDFKKRSGG